MDDGDELLRQVEYRLVRQGRDIRRETDALLDHLRASDVPPADRLWDRYRALDGDGTALLSSGLDLLDGIAMRSRGLDDGAVDIAHALVAQLARQALAQPPVAVVPRASTGSDLTRLGVVGLEEADWSIWTLPMVAGEYGSVMATGDPLREVVDTVAGSAPFWASQPVVVRLTADAFATYTVGPAYPLAAIRLRLTLPPDEATLLRADVMLATLSEMSRRDTSDQISAQLEQLTGSWEALCRELAYRPSSQVADPRATELADALREAFEVMLFPGAQYDARRATRLALQWRDMADLSRRLTIDPAETDVRDILNAAWIMRESDPASAPEVADAARAACLDVARRQRSSGLTALRL
jgi:hypothetical protein